MAHKITVDMSESLYAYLSGGYVPGLGKAFAELLKNAFGSSIADILDKDPDKILTVKGIGEKKRDMLLEEWKERRPVIYIQGWLSSLGLSRAYAGKIYDYYGASAPEYLEKNPYDMAVSVPGIGFITADKIALGIGAVSGKKDVRRLHAAVIKALQQAADNGNTCLSWGQLAYQLKNWLSLEDWEASRKRVYSALGSWMRAETCPVVRRWRTEEDRPKAYYYLKPIFFAEYGTAKCLVERIQNLDTGKSVSDADLQKCEEAAGVTYTAEQKAAIRNAVSRRLSVITGGPGTGKTKTIAGILAAYRAEGLHTALAAPTGKAAKRLGDLSGQQAGTIHKLLGYNPETHGFIYNKWNQLPIDAVVIDESSMVNIQLASALLEALAPDTRIVFVGDADQLPPVGAGRVFDTLCEEGEIPVTRLTKVMRQAAGSGIIKAAAMIRVGLTPDLPAENADITMIEEEDPDTAMKRILEQITTLKTKEGITTTAILTPVRTSAKALNISEINAAAQKAFNADGALLPDTFSLRPFRIGDPVMQTKNNYDLGIANGETGWIRGYDEKSRCLLIDFGGEKPISYPSAMMVDLELAYACTVHKAQGSEYDAVVMPVWPTHRSLNRRLLYTAVTRAKKNVMLVGSRTALQKGIESENDREPICWLMDTIKEIEAKNSGSEENGQVNAKVL